MYNYTVSMYLSILAGCSNESPIQLTPFNSFMKTRNACTIMLFGFWVPFWHWNRTCQTAWCYAGVLFAMCRHMWHQIFLSFFQEKNRNHAVNISNQCCQYVVLHITWNSVFGWTLLGILKIIQKYRISLIKFVWSKLVLTMYQ